jgi:hypothetical protein
MNSMNIVVTKSNSGAASSKPSPVSVVNVPDKENEYTVIWKDLHKGNPVPLRTIEACLNQTTSPSIRLKFVCNGSGITIDSVRQKIGHFTSQLFGSKITAGASNEDISFPSQEEDVQDANGATVHVRVKSLPLGKIVTTRSPAHRVDSHPGHCEVSDWIDNMGKLSFESIKPVDIEEFRASLRSSWRQEVYEDRQQTARLPSEHRFVEYKMFASLNRINGECITEDLRTSFTACLNSQDTALSVCQIWFGVHDHLRIAVGLPSTPDLKTKFVDTVAAWAVDLFPPLSSQHVEIAELDVVGTCPTDWTACTWMEMNEKEARCCMLCLLGRVSVRVSPRSAKVFEVFADKDMVDMVGPLLKEFYELNGNMPYDDTHERIKLSLDFAATLWNTKSGDSEALVPDSLEWTTRDWDIVEASAVNDLQYELLRRKMVRVSVSQQGAIHSWHNQKSDIKVHSMDASEAPYELQTWQIWLRAKGHQYGPRSSLYHSLLSNTFERILVVGNDERQLAEWCLRAYVGSAVQLDSVVAAKPDESLVNRLRHVMNVVLITTVRSMKLCDDFAESLHSKGRPLPSCLLLCPVDSNISIVDSFRSGSKFYSIQDVIIMSPSCLQSGPNGAVDHFITAHDLMPPPSDIVETAKKWYLGSIPTGKFPEELAQHDWIVDTQNVRTCVQLVNSAEPNRVTHLRICKFYDGSGATSLLGRVSWLLKQYNGFICKFPSISTPKNASFWDPLSAGYKYAVFIDDNVEIDVPEIISAAPPNLHVVIVQIVKTRSGCNMEIDPFLSVHDLGMIVRKLTTLIPTAEQALSILHTHVQANSGRQDRHIYVVMHVAATGKFEPAERFLLRVYQELTEDKRCLAVLLALLSSFAAGTGIALNTLPGEMVELGDITVVTADRIKFLHPWIGRVFLHLVTSELHRNCLSNVSSSNSSHASTASSAPKTGSLDLKAIWMECCCKAIDCLRLDAKCGLELIISIFVRRRWSNFSPFVYNIYQQGGVNLLQEILRSKQVIRYFDEGHVYILLSRVHRLLGKNAVESLDCAEDANAEFRDTTYSFLAFK